MSAVYFVAVHNVSDPEQLQEYLAGAAGSLGAGEILAADENATTFEGNARTRLVILRFPSEDDALGWYNSEAYQKVLPLRLNSISDNWAGLATAFA